MKTLSFTVAILSSLTLISCATKKHADSQDYAGGRAASTAQFKYNELMIKDYDEMSQMVNGLLKKARSVGSNSSDDNVDDPEAIAHLREALKLILSRPDSDNMIAKIIPEVRKELNGYNAFEDSISGLTTQCLAVVKDEESAINGQATCIFMLENILSLIRPEASSNPEMRRIIERVKQADVEVTTDVKKDMKLRGMFKTRNPSELAEEILKKSPLPKEDKKKKK